MTHPDNFLYSYCINNYRVFQILALKDVLSSPTMLRFPMIGNNFDVGFVITKVSVL